MENIVLSEYTMDGKTEDVVEDMPSAVDDAADVMSQYDT
jgi:hypothetical protein